jgi:hypothetical protein
MARRYIGRGVHAVTGVRELLTTFSAAGTLKAYGVNQIVGSTAVPNYSLPAPSRGQWVTITAGLCASGKTATVRPSSLGIYFASSGTTVTNLRKLTFNGANDTVTLLGLSSVRWLITSNVGSVAVAAT